MQVFKEYRLFALSFEDNTVRTKHTDYFPKVEIEAYNGCNFFNQLVKNEQNNKNNTKTNDNIRKIVKGQGDDSKTGLLIDFFYFKEN